MWTRKKLKMNSGGLLRGAREGRKNTFTAGNGHHPGRRVALGSPGNRTNRMASLGNWVNRTGSLDNWANRNSEAGRPVDLDR
jgi:hypothetical protein